VGVGHDRLICPYGGPKALIIFYSIWPTTANSSD